MRLLTDEEGKIALAAAKFAVYDKVAKTVNTEKAAPPDISDYEIFNEKRGVFVTLTEDGELRGCIGYPYPVLPLGEALHDAAVSAAVRDPRFMPVREDELAAIEFEVTILTPPELLTCSAAERPKNIEVGRHGLIIKDRGMSGLLLPQVATEYGWDAEEFLMHTCIKAGTDRDAWKRDDTALYTFEGQIFSERQ
ncbi:TIGR00296 family protein [Methanomicrobium mobile]|uniref:TIGR00296 family protein n=1 Tax=Methanomicrobium mobile TaxID=2205 RepID=UPI0005B2A8EC|nr:TIGR00296 family protein [Methanomicrobium mobile]